MLGLVSGETQEERRRESVALALTGPAIYAWRDGGNEPLEHMHMSGIN